MVSVPSELLASRVTLSLTTLAALAVVYRLLTRPRRLVPPGAHAPRRAPSSHWLLGDIPALLRNAARFNEYLVETTRACGEQPWLQTGPLMPDMVIVATPAIVEDVTKTQHDVFGKGDFTRDMLHELTGDSFFSLDGAAWFHQRKTASKFFSTRMYREVATPTTHAHIARAMAKLEAARANGASVNLSAVLSAFALQNFAQLGFGLDIERVDPAPLDAAFDEAFVCVFNRMQRPVWLWRLEKWLNVGNEKTYRGIVAFIRSFVSTLVRDSLEKSRVQATAATGGDKDATTTTTTATTMVELFIDAMQKGENEFSADLLCDLAIMFVLAGRDTTSDTLNWLFYSLSLNRAVEDRIRAELWDKVPDLMTGKAAAISMDQAQTLVYLEAAIKEAMRLYPASTLSPRQALRDTVLADGTFIRKGVNIGISAYAMARLPSVWGDETAQFKPERFLDAATGKLAAVPPFKFYGFGAGPRSCIGMHLAMLEMKMLVAAMLSRFRFDYAPNDGRYKFSATVTLETPLMVHVHPAK